MITSEQEEEEEDAAEQCKHQQLTARANPSHLCQHPPVIFLTKCSFATLHVSQIILLVE